MKKYIGLISIIGIIVLMFNTKGVQATKSLDGIDEKLIRFHVLANSNSEEDQTLKLKVRDKVLEYITPKLEKSKSIDESRSILKKEENNMVNVASEVIKNEGYSYSVKTTLGRTNFPEKTYGNITLPQGEYEAFRILIGEAKGENWWCVMFPPLCFVDMTKGQISYEKSEEEIKKVLSEEEANAVIDKENSKIELRFKLLELLK
ncbi:stage II sporulation protein R [Clostridium massiliamazoniense]|uniref:stage II sporulation protein R n=1 Tax=Clostridium massiliamazoniense TaxID=1347366 RepID=UPI0006D776CB|nr:stage II sporulation protein R [Clostridium massiliamazoniense]